MIFLDSALETILECWYHDRELPDNSYIREEIERYVDENVLKPDRHGYRLTEFGRESLLDCFELEYEGLMLSGQLTEPD